MRTIEQMTAAEVLCCMSSLVATLCNAYGLLPHNVENAAPAADLCEQAQELCYPIDDWEEAAIQAGWTRTDKGDGQNADWRWHLIGDDAEYGYSSARDACEDQDIGPYQREVFEHWAVTDWLANKLEAAGEKVDKDFAGLCIWARTTTGQAIYADAVIERIYAETHRA